MNDFKHIPYFIFCQVQGIRSYVEVLDPFRIEFCAAENLLVTHSCHEREVNFSLRVWSLIGLLYSGGCPHTQEYMSTTNLDLMGLKNE